MPKGAPTTVFFCKQCGGETPKWLGRCPACGEWNTLVEAPKASGKDTAHGGQPLRDAQVQELSSVESGGAVRIATPYRELNRVLGGGLVQGSLVLIGGDPGIGKSTLLLQIAQAVVSPARPVLYVSGEESGQQIRLRADRLGIKGDGLFFLAETDLNKIIGALDETKPALVIVDSIQTTYIRQVESVAGSVSQVRESTLRLMQWAKSNNVPVMIAGHVTKEGAIAGPRVLEHMVDVVLYLEGESFSAYRILRSVKNRFGSTNEVGIFEMQEAGLVEVANPSEAFLSQRQAGAIGSAIVPTLEGTRPLMVEVQALVTPTNAPIPRRTTNGVDYNRVILICAVLTKHLGIGLSTQDVVINVTGGMRIAEPAADLAIALAIVSSLRDAALDPGLVTIGEIGLTGELRPVSQLDRRLAESAALGFKSCLVPRSASERYLNGTTLEVRTARSVREATRMALAHLHPNKDG